MISLDSTAGANKKNILDALVTKLKEITVFGKDVHKAYRMKMRSKYQILIHLFEDRLGTVTTGEETHYINFNIVVKMKAKYLGAIHPKESDLDDELDSFVDLVGLVEDKIKANISNLPTWENILIKNIRYTAGQEGFQGSRPTMVYYKALMKVEVYLQW